MTTEEKKIYMYQWRARNHNRVLKVRRAYYARTAEARKAESKAEQKRNGSKPHRVIAKKKYQKLYRQTNPLKVMTMKRAWSAKNPDYIKQWHLANPGKQPEYSNRRRARRVAATTEDCTSRIKLLKLMPFCQYCFHLIKGTPSTDHVIPLVRGGKHAPSNLVAACIPCNSSKKDKLLSEWPGRLEMAA